MKELSLFTGAERFRQQRQGEYVRPKRSKAIEDWQAGWPIHDGKTRESWWNPEPRLDRVANGVANSSNRLKAIGNGQVSLTMACAYEILSREFLQ